MNIKNVFIEDPPHRFPFSVSTRSPHSWRPKDLSIISNDISPECLGKPQRQPNHLFKYLDDEIFFF